ncbi:hypothetical protein [Alteromonas sp. C1M14]|uniref:hypothetical protein n=1 Tax=Alteromonas sp. C1M14 TaxID=2841567 RepID=UPI001C0903B0|nr:hypothetical protein [Alteromonas sp. C1M14]MBU2977146.1 hypothetical protein [Alteromonas sp. C1M14]
MTPTLWNQAVKQDGFYHIYNLDCGQIPSSCQEVVEGLPGPAVLHIKGMSSVCRVIVTLLHGDEPTSLRTVLDVLHKNILPATNIKIVIVSVDAAALPPLFSHPFEPGKRDLNRCFREPFLYQDSHPANNLYRLLDGLSPECVINLHDTASGVPSFALSMNKTPAHVALGSYFCDTLIHSPIIIGALTDLPLEGPVVSVYTPQNAATKTNEKLTKGLLALWQDKSVQGQTEVQTISQPRRLELRRSAALTYSDKPVFGVNCTLRNDIESCSFVTLQPGDTLGWVDHNRLDHFRIVGRSNREQVSTFFSANDNCLTVNQTTTLFLLSKNPELAKSDCLFYFSAE